MGIGSLKAGNQLSCQNVGDEYAIATKVYGAWWNVQFIRFLDLGILFQEERLQVLGAANYQIRYVEYNLDINRCIKGVVHWQWKKNQLLVGCLD